MRLPSEERGVVHTKRVGPCNPGAFVFCLHTNPRKRYDVFKYTAHYTDFNGKDCVKDLYFHMMAPEMVDLEFNPMVNGSMSDFVKNAFKENDGAKIYVFSKLMIVNSYGKRSDDGSSFIKKPEYTEEFINSPAYEAFFLWLTLEDPSGGHMQKFWEGIVPDRVMKQVQELEAAAEKQPDKKTIQDMTKEEIVALFEKTIAEKAVEAPK